MLDADTFTICCRGTRRIMLIRVLCFMQPNPILLRHLIAADVFSFFGHISVTLVVFASDFWGVPRIVVAIVTVVVIVLMVMVIGGVLFGIFRVHLW